MWSGFLCLNNIIYCQSFKVDQIGTVELWILILLYCKESCKSECGPPTLSSRELGNIISGTLTQITFLLWTQISFLWLLPWLWYFPLFLTVIPTFHYIHQDPRSMVFYSEIPLEIQWSSYLKELWWESETSCLIVLVVFLYFSFMFYYSCQGSNWWTQLSKHLRYIPIS